MPGNLTHIRLLVSNFKECFLFYRDVMGFRYQGGDESGPYVEFFAGGQMMLALFDQAMMSAVVHTTGRPASAEAQDTITLCFDVPNVDETATQIRAAGVVLVNEPMNVEPWSLRVAHFRDPAGNLIEINQNLPER